MQQAIRITSARHGFIRGGVAHPATPTDYPLDYFTEAQADAISVEPMLTVELVEVDEAELDYHTYRGREDFVAVPLLCALGSDLLNLPLGGGRSIQLIEIITLAHDASGLSLDDWNAHSPEERAAWMEQVLDDAAEDQRVFMEQEAKASAAASGALLDADASMTSASGTAPATPPPAATQVTETPAQKKAREKKEAADKKAAEK